jgi:hypothetical protein
MTLIMENQVDHGFAEGQKRWINANKSGGAGSWAGIDRPGCRSLDSNITSNSNWSRVTWILLHPMR